MNFINSSIIRFALITVVLSVAFYFMLDYLIAEDYGIMIIVLSVLYGGAMFTNGLLNGMKDIYEGHYGFNYNLVTYLLGCTIPLLMGAIGLISEKFVDLSLKMFIYWGLGVAIHGVAYIFLSRNRAIKGFDKGEIFK